MRVLFCGNGLVGWRAVQRVREAGDEVVGLVLPPPEARRFGPEIVEAAGDPTPPVIEDRRVGDPPSAGEVAALRADLALSVYFPRIFPPAWIGLFPAGIVNLHPSLLPWNRGAYPNVWSIVERTPAGVTLHYVDEGVDTGDLIAQREVPVEPVDTGESLYGKLERAAVALFDEQWPALREGRAPRAPQPAGGSLHRRADVARIDPIDPDATCRAGDLIDILRARTFPPHDGAYLLVGGRKVHLRLSLRYDEPHTPREEEGSE